MNDKPAPVDLATDITIAWLANPNTKAEIDDVPAFLASVFNAVTRLDGAAPTSENPQAGDEQNNPPAVSVRRSLASREHIISLIDGKPYRTLTRHLSRHGLTPETYRARYGLKHDYPMTAPAYSEARSAMAKRTGLGRKPGTKVARPTPDEAAPGKRRKLGLALK
ncbi:MucR family transcriptional regulator [Sphingomonas lycopersici]|uniref:MucR family transcriptional regulator n=1 Tax=Sphingomonas lycopersici TaxID=2951807 RepID=A0AA42CR09_9SPHN|nr:MucR family transcriptional regulator [Sphingomonas lycopersici]MCW6530759.1 MucR family transcriptional regulator [Sphingomonas lycopersici]MCW6536240.1 MucR family transcriptional regulator [Sphingomonas lycopersici]